ncbi:BQ5605_C011g06433 [Microbotryum silenes-dioicae]|uniref:BQ5605_C011g06433 protein n=1 Tax=Microbotryum silenes-dioicae TaxID=796604 RepID=A0A2X0LP20_9BASI|nr:BQ5605_C011g06433 [Microbotryum silenes-dioicae]
MPAACNIATNSKANGKLPSRNSLQHVLFECQLSSCFFTRGRIDFVRLRIRVIGTPNVSLHCHCYRWTTARILIVVTNHSRNRLWSRELRLTIPWQILNVLVRWGDHRVGRGSEAMPSCYSTARFGGVTVVLAGDPKQCLPGFRSNAFPLFPSRLLHGMLTSGGKLSNNIVNGKGLSESVPVRSGPTQFFAEPCLYHINIDESFYFQRI